MRSSFHKPTQDKYQRYFLKSLIVSVIIALGILLFFSSPSGRFIPKPNHNKFNTQLNSDLENISLVKPANFIGLANSEIKAVRIESVKRNPQYLVGSYEPSSIVFDTIEDNLSWYSFPKFYKDGPGKNNSESVESIAVLNPLILVVPEFWGISIWGEKKLRWVKDIGVPSDLLSVKPSSLAYDPKNKTATVTYIASSYISEIKPFIEVPLSVQDIDFGVQAYNALDLGFQYIQFSVSKSSSIEAPKGERVLNITDYLTFAGNMCGEPCNHRSNPNPELDTYKVTSVPSRAVFNLWREYSENSPPDFTFAIEVL